MLDSIDSEIYQEWKENLRNQRQKVMRHRKSNKAMFTYEKMTQEEEKKYMEETNLETTNIQNMTRQDFEKLPQQTQKIMLEGLIEKYGNNTEISRHTKMDRGAIRNLRIKLGLPDAKHTTRGYTRKDIEDTKTGIENSVSMKIHLNNISGEEVRKKLESAGLFIDEKGQYSLDISINEVLYNPGNK